MAGKLKLPNLKKSNPDKVKKKKILLMSDDLRMHSGIATQSKEFVMGTMKHYDWVQIAGAVKHPEQGKIVDMSEAAKNELGVESNYLYDKIISRFRFQSGNKKEDD